jgi:hypothetical protein
MHVGASRYCAYRGDEARRSKADRRASRRAAMTTLTAMGAASGNGEAGKPVVFRFKGGARLELESLQERVMYRELAAVLGSAFQAHMEANPLLHDAFGMDDILVCCCALRIIPLFALHLFWSSKDPIVSPCFIDCHICCL